MARLLPFALCLLMAATAGAAEARRPNVILIMTDNHGAWTLGCYGNRDILTPNIDALAAEGVLFEQAFACNAVCSPTRASYLTGLMPSQHGVHCFLNRATAQMGDNPYCTIAEFRTLPKSLASAGYDCGLVGKWHLGANMQPQEGFKYWITMPHGGTSTFYDAEVIEHGELRNEPKYLTDLWTEHAVRFIKQKREQPFFLFLSYNGPYSLGPLLLRPPRNRHYATYAEETFPSFPRAEMHPWQHANKDYHNNVVAMRRFAAELSGVDDGVGTVMQTLRQQGLDENTLVVFCADQGWVGGQNGLWGMGDHTRPLTAFDGMMRVPLIVRHKGSLPEGQRNAQLVSIYDVMPSLLSYLQLDAGELGNPQSPGRDFTPLLRGESAEWDDVVYYEMENVRTIRTRTWKYTHRHPEGPHELYDLEHDPHEWVNLYGQPQHVSMQQELALRLEAFFAEHADPRYDLYHGGGSKSHLLSQPGVKPLGPPR